MAISFWCSRSNSARSRCGLVEPLVLGAQLGLEQRDVASALAQHVGGARHVNERGVAELRPVGANGHEEMGLVGRGFARVHAHLHGVAGRVRLEGDAFHVVFEKQRDVREDGLQFGGELGEIELVDVKRIGARAGRATPYNTAGWAWRPPVGRWARARGALPPETRASPPGARSPQRPPPGRSCHRGWAERCRRPVRSAGWEAGSVRWRRRWLRAPRPRPPPSPPARPARPSRSPPRTRRPTRAFRGPGAPRRHNAPGAR